MAAAAQVVIAYAAIFAIVQYALAWADIKDRKTKNVLDLVKFFREDVIRSGEVIKEELRKSKVIVFPRIRLTKNTPSFNFTEKEFMRKIWVNQKYVVKEYQKTIAEHPVFDVKVRDCLNAAEEFAIGILNSSSQNHPVVSSIKKPFIETLEMCAVPLYLYIGLMGDKFESSAKLYRLWKRDIGYLPQTEGERLEQFEELAKSKND